MAGCWFYSDAFAILGGARIEAQIKHIGCQPSTDSPGGESARQYRDYCKGVPLEFILTLNLPETLPFAEHEYPFPLKIIRNPSPLGFGENHNQAFRQASGDFFCVLNPDIRIREDVFGPLIEILEKDRCIGLVAPQVVNPVGAIEDSARFFPTPLEVFKKVFGYTSRKYSEEGRLSFPDWVAGMFMLLPSHVFRQISGFDARYFLYYEDVDLCARLQIQDYRVALCRDMSIVHDARRTSHRNLKYLRWHAVSMLQFFLSSTYRAVRRRMRVMPQQKGPI